MTDRQRHDSHVGRDETIIDTDGVSSEWIRGAVGPATARELDLLLDAFGSPTDKFMRAQSLLAEVQVELLQIDVELTDLRAFKVRVAEAMAAFVAAPLSLSSLQPFFALNDELNPKEPT